MRYARRLVPGAELRVGGKPRLSLIESSWRWRVAHHWEELPQSIKIETKLSTFRAKLKIWVKENIEV